MKKIAAFFFMILLYHGIYAQNTISGIITDEHNEALVGTSIFIPELNKGTISGTDGYFKLTSLPQGLIKVQFSSLGYSTEIVSLRLNGDTTEMHIQLRATPIEMESLVVSGGYSGTQHENAVKIETLKLNLASSISTPNFAEILTKVPGVDMISKGSGVSKPVIRGLSMNDILILNNGVRLENYQYSSHHPLGIDEFGISEVEIIKGPASQLYGSDAIGGVINFIKENPAPVNSIMGDYNLQLFSNTLGITNNFGVKGATEKFFGGIRLGHKTNSDFLQGGGVFVPNSRFNMYSLKTNAGYTDKIGTFKLYYDFNNQQLGLVEDEAVEEITERGRKTTMWFQELNSHLLSSRNTLYLQRFKLNVNTALQNTELIHFGALNEYEIQMKLTTITYETKLHLPSNHNSEYIVGFQGFNQVNTNVNDRETKLLPEAITQNYSLFTLLQYTFFNKVKLQSGIRYDVKTIDTKAISTSTDTMAYRAAIDKTYDSFSGSIGATYFLSDILLLRTNLAAAFRTPNLAELTSRGQHELRFEIGDNNLVPENAYEADLSVHYHKDNVTLDMAGFYNSIANYIFIAPTGTSTADGLAIYQYQQADAALYGGELGLHIHPEMLDWLHFESSFSGVIGKQKSGGYLPFIPAHKLRFELSAEKKKLLVFHKAFASATASVALDQNNIAPDESKTRGYTLADFSIGGNISIKNQLIGLRISANNLFDVLYIDHLSTLKEVNFYNPGRNITLAISIPFTVNNPSTD